MVGRTNTRKSTPRSKSGCKNCRTRRIKCGEETPQCAKCQRAGLLCEWYQEPTGQYGTGSRYGSNPENFYTFPVKPVQSSESSTGSEKDADTRDVFREHLDEGNSQAVGGEKGKAKFRPGRKWIYIDGNARRSTHPGTRTAVKDASDPASTFSRRTTELQIKVPGTERERFLFNYFILESIPDLCGYSHMDFWYRSVPLYSQSEPAIRYAVLSLAAFHQEHIATQDMSPTELKHKPSTLIAYSKALQHGQEYLSSPNPNDEVVLMCCLLFYMIENARGDFNIATRHALAGLAILKKFGARPKSKVNLMNGPLDDINDALVSHFATLDGRFSFGSNYGRPGLTLVTKSERKGLTPIVPREYHSMTEISAVGLKLTNWAFCILNSVIREHEFETMDSITPELLREIGTLVREQNHSAIALQKFADLRNSSKKTSWNEISQILNHQILHHTTASIFSGALASATSSTPITNMLNHLQTILYSSETLQKGLLSNEPDRRSFLCLRGIISSLVIVAVECEDAEIRRRSIHLLRNWPIREGLIDGNKAADAIERRAAMEAASAKKGNLPVAGRKMHFGKASAVVGEVVRLSIVVRS